MMTYFQLQKLTHKFIFYIKKIIYLHNILREYQRSNEIFTKYEHDDIIIKDIDHIQLY